MVTDRLLYLRRVTVGKRIRQARLLKGLSQNELDRRIGAAVGTTSRIESGKRGTRGLPDAMIEKYAEVLGIRVIWLLTETGPMERNDDPAPERARAVEVARADGEISEAAITYALSKPPDASKSAMFWIRMMLAHDADLKFDAALSAPPRRKP